MVENELGIHYAEENFYQLEARLREVCAFSSTTPEDLLAAAQSRGLQPAERAFLLDLATNNESSFFRDAAVFENLRSVLLPEVLSKTGGRVRLWSAAASHGQEAYSLAMIGRDLMRTHGPAQFEIVASDIAERVLARAREGRFSQLEVQRGLSSRTLIENFTQIPEGSAWAIKEELRRMVDFRRQNLMTDFSHLGLFDVILCRNVMIYFKPEVKADLIRRLADQLKPEGIMILGNGETLYQFSDRFDRVCEGSAVYYRLKKLVDFKAA